MVSARISLTLILCAAVLGEDAPDFVDVADEEACEMQQTLLQQQMLRSTKKHTAEDQKKRPLCAVGDHGNCPGTSTKCSGDQCCPDGSTCPSASVDHVEGCTGPKTFDCTTQLVEECTIGDHLMCPDGSGIMCSGDQCCPGGSTCPSASKTHVEGCAAPKVHSCAPSAPPPLLQESEEGSRHHKSAPSFICEVHEHLMCPDGSGRMCSGNQCCPDGSTCPSAEYHHVDGCAAPKTHDCTRALAASTCSVGDHLECPDGSGRMCSGDQCCPDGSTCPSASVNHVHGCAAPKSNDCTGVSLLALSQKASVGNHFLCAIEEHITCPDGSGRMCSGDQCCPDGSTCPSASVNHVEGCAKEKKHDCTTHQVPNVCEVADHLTCPDGSGIKCSGDQCCPGGSTCPSASVDHVEGCTAPKTHDCTGQSASLLGKLQQFKLQQSELQQDKTESGTHSGYCGPHHRNHVGDDVQWPSGVGNVWQSNRGLQQCFDLCNEFRECSAINYVWDAPWLPAGIFRACYLKRDVYHQSNLNDGYKDWASVYFKC